MFRMSCTKLKQATENDRPLSINRVMFACCCTGNRRSARQKRLDKLATGGGDPMQSILKEQMKTMDNQSSPQRKHSTEESTTESTEDNNPEFSRYLERIQARAAAVSVT